jgi:hypothetical protein
MAMRIVADSLDDLPAALRDKAQSGDNGVVVREMPEGWAVEDVGGLKRSVIEARKERDEAQRVAKAFEGIDPEKAADAREALEKLTAGQLRGSKEIDEYKATIESKYASDREKAKAREDALLEQVKEMKTRGELAPIIAKMGGSDAMDAILTLAQRHIRYEQDGAGQLKASLVSADGSPLVTTKAGSADPMGFEEFVTQMREAPGTRGLFKSTATGGSGGSSQSGGSGPAVGQDITNMSPAEMIQLGDRGA